MKDIIKRDSVKRYTILIPNYNRPNYLRRLLSYYNKFGENYNMIIADSSSNENKKINKNIISKFSKLNIFYIDKYSPTVKGHQKFLEAINQVKTKYSVFCADDDFITPNGINQSVDFLEKNPDFSCAHGHYISFYFGTNKMGRKILYWLSIYPYKSISFANVKDRLFFHFSSYYPTIYAVHRTDLLKLIFKDAVEFTDDYRFGELLPSMLDLIYGKMKKLDILYSAREMIPNSCGRTAKNLLDFIKDGTYDDKYAKFRECLVKALVSEEDISKEKAQKLIDKAMNQYLGSSIFKLKLKAGLKRIIEHNVLLKKFYLVYRQFKTIKKQILVLDRLTAIEYGNKENPYYEDFVRIKEVVEKGIME